MAEADADLEPIVGSLGPQCAVCEQDDYRPGASVTVACAQGCCAVVMPVCRECATSSVTIAPAKIKEINEAHDWRRSDEANDEG